MTPDPTPQPPDHGAAGFCTDHGRPAGRPTTVAEAMEAGARVLRAHLHGYPSNGSEADHWRAAVGAVLEAVGYADLLAKAGATVALADYKSACRNQARAEAEGAIWLGRAAERLRERDAARAALDRVRAVCAQIEAMPIPADPGMSQTAITGRVVATIIRAVRAALDPEEPR